MTDVVAEYDLDPAFADNARRLSTKIDMLKVGEMIDPSDLNPLPDDWQPQPPLEGYDKYSFFDPAAALSGQNLDMIEGLYEPVRDVWLRFPLHIEEFDSHMGHVLAQWEGTAAPLASLYKGSVVGFVRNECASLDHLGRALLAYAAIIQEARSGLNELMVACAESWDAVTAGRETAGIDAAITVLATLTAALLTGVTGGGALPVFATVLTGIGDVAGKTVVQLAGDTHADVADAYLQAAQKLVADAALAITDNVYPELSTARTLAPSAPQPPAGISDPGQFHPSPA